MPSSTSISPPPDTLPADFEPLNREPSPQELLSAHLTPVSLAYDRNHGPIPQINGSTHKVSVSSTCSWSSLSSPSSSHSPRSHTSLSPNDLRSLFPPVTMTCALQCAGNRRHTMRTKLKEVNGIDWASGAVMNCSWTGARLVDVLEHCLSEDLERLRHRRHHMANGSAPTNGHGQSNGYCRPDSPNLDGLHVAFACNAGPVQEDSWYGSSIPLSRALNPESDILLAYEQNHKPLTPEHGYPIRVVIPGIAGARSVKWLDSITIQDHESSNFYQQRDYKILPPQASDVKAAKDWWAKVDALMDMPINSVVFAQGATARQTHQRGTNGSSDSDSDSYEDLNPVDGNTVDQYGDGTVYRDEHGSINVRGYALPAGSDGPVTRVEIRVDQGEWVEAELLYQDVQDGKNACTNGFTNGHTHNGTNGISHSHSNGNSRNNKWSWALFRWSGPVKPGKHTIWSRATDRAGNRQESERSEWNLRGVAYDGYGEAEIEVL